MLKIDRQQVHVSVIYSINLYLSSISLILAVSAGVVTVHDSSLCKSLCQSVSVSPVSICADQLLLLFIDFTCQLVEFLDFFIVNPATRRKVSSQVTGVAAA